MAEQHFHEQGPGIDATTPARRRGRPSKKGRGLLELLIVLLVAFALVFGLVRPFVVQTFYIPSESMIPTLEVGDRIFVNKFVYRFSEPERGDIVVFEKSSGVGDEDLIKRVIALPGDHVALYEGELYVNFRRLDEPYVEYPYTRAAFGGSLGALTVPKGRILVLGDNRTNSRDSRYFGPVSMDSIEGEAFAIFWPPSRIGLL